MSIIACTPAACSEAPPYISFLGGTEVSKPQIISEDHPCRVGFPCILGGLPATIWTAQQDGVAIDHPEHPEHPDHPDHPDHPVHPVQPPPCETPEPGTLALVGVALGLLGLRRRGK